MAKKCWLLFYIVVSQVTLWSNEMETNVRAMVKLRGCELNKGGI